MTGDAALIVAELTFAAGILAALVRLAVTMEHRFTALETHLERVRCDVRTLQATQGGRRRADRENTPHD